jgi:hypothetical protein
MSKLLIHGGGRKPKTLALMEQNALKNVNNCWNTKITFDLETSGGQSSNQYLDAAYFFNASVN